MPRFIADRRIAPSALALCAILIVVGVGIIGPSRIERHLGITFPATPTPRLASAEAILLPNEEVWNGVPSYIFGTNDTQRWDSQHTLETIPAIQQRLKADHFPLLRTWFFQYDLNTHKPISDSAQLARVQALENAGMACLGVLWTANTIEYDKHIVQLLGKRCLLYEFMNEPDLTQPNGAAPLTAQRYLDAWNSAIPQLRAINPAAQFGGPTSGGPQGNDCTYTAAGATCFMQKFLIGVKKSGVLPDFVTFHWYPCWQAIASACLALAPSYGQVTKQVAGWVKQFLGKPLPVGITEWNADPSAPMPSYAQDPEWMREFTTTALHAMIAAGLSFACQFDLASYAGYGSDDMVDIYHDGAPKAQYLAMVEVMRQVRSNTQPSRQPRPSRRLPRRRPRRLETPHARRASPPGSQTNAARRA